LLRNCEASRQQHIACYFVNHGQKQPEFKAAINECLKAANEAEICVKAVVTDQEPTQWAHIKKTVSLSQPSFPHPTTGEPVYFILDVPHCLKNTRNCLLKHDIEYGGNKRATWRHLREFYESERRRELKLAVKLTDAHFCPGVMNCNRLLLQVSYGAQNARVSAALNSPGVAKPNHDTSHELQSPGLAIAARSGCVHSRCAAPHPHPPPDPQAPTKLQGQYS
jgi:hypothetical protein